MCISYPASCDMISLYQKILGELFTVKIACAFHLKILENSRAFNFVILAPKYGNVLGNSLPVGSAKQTRKFYLKTSGCPQQYVQFLHKIFPGMLQVIIDNGMVLAWKSPPLLACKSTHIGPRTERSSPLVVSGTRPRGTEGEECSVGQLKFEFCTAARIFGVSRFVFHSVTSGRELGQGISHSLPPGLNPPRPCTLLHKSSWRIIFGASLSKPPKMFLHTVHTTKITGLKMRVKRSLRHIPESVVNCFFNA